MRAQAAYQQALDLAGRRTPVAVAQACLGLAQLTEHTNTATALDWVAQGIAAAAAHPALSARLERRRGSILYLQQDLAAAQVALERALHLADPTDLTTRADAYVDLGNLACQTGAFDRGAELFQAALALYERANDIWRMLPVQQNLAQLAEISGDWAGALDAYAQTQALAERLGRVETAVRMQLAQGILHLNRGAYDQAWAMLEAARAAAEHHGLVEPLIAAHASCADLALRLHDLPTAQTQLAAAELWTSRSGIQTQQAELLTLRATYALLADDPTTALDLAQAAVDLAHTQQNALDQGRALRVVAQIHLHNGDQSAAQAALAPAHELLADEPYEVARTWVIVAACFPPESAAQQQARATAEALFAQLGVLR
jgi:tetratricopeptide (TPR) repeat protein